MLSRTLIKESIRDQERESEARKRSILLDKQIKEFISNGGKIKIIPIGEIKGNIDD
ncbi:hypothetical protein [uncultured Mediterranean phage uvMED]|nr:hypothetical protein [uncultured Mediterranean phage uvMED]